MPIELIDTIKPKNDGAFPMVEAEDVVVGKGTDSEKRLPEALEGKAAKTHTHDAGNIVSGLVSPERLPQATTEKRGAIALGDGLELVSPDDANNTKVRVKPATADSIGGVKVGEGLSVEADGTLSGLVTGIDESIPYPYTNRPGVVPSTDCLRNYCANRNTYSVVNGNRWTFQLSGNTTAAIVIQINKDDDGHVVFDGWGRFEGTYTLANVEEVEAKQDKLIAGDGITIAEDGKTISATGGGSDVAEAIAAHNGDGDAHHDIRVSLADKAEAEHTHEVSDVVGLSLDLNAKQDKLVAGEGIAIAEDGKTISATGGGGVAFSAEMNNFLRLVSGADYLNFDAISAASVGYYSILYGVNGFSANLMFPTWSKFTTEINKRAALSNNLSSFEIAAGTQHVEISLNGAAIQTPDTATESDEAYLYVLDSSKENTERAIHVLSKDAVNKKLEAAKKAAIENAFLTFNENTLSLSFGYQNQSGNGKVFGWTYNTADQIVILKMSLGAQSPNIAELPTKGYVDNRLSEKADADVVDNGLVNPEVAMIDTGHAFRTLPYAFTGCGTIETIRSQFFDGGDYAFANSTVAKAYVRYIDSFGLNMFNNARNFEGFFSDPNYNGGVVENRLKGIAAGAFAYCKLPISQINFLIGSGEYDSTWKKSGNVTVISSSAFSNCGTGTDVLIIPPNVTTIGNSAFSNIWCEEIRIESPNLQLRSAAFNGCRIITTGGRAPLPRHKT